MSSIHSGSHTPSFAPSSGDAKPAEDAAEAKPAAKSSAPKPTDSLSEPTPVRHSNAAPALHAPRPTMPPRGKLGTERTDAPMFRSASARAAVRTPPPDAQGPLAVHSEPISSLSRGDAGPTDYQEHFYELGSELVVPTDQMAKDAKSLARVIDRREGLKMYMYEPQPGQMYAISHAASESGLPDGKSTQHIQLQRALLMFGVGRSLGRYQTEDKDQMKANKMMALASLKSPQGPQHGGLRLQKHEGQFVLDVSSSFSFHKTSDANMDHIARFYASVLRYAENPPEKVGVIPVEASCHPKYCMEASPHLHDLARRIEAYLEE